MINNPGVVTERDPDTVRCPNVVYDSDQRLPKGELPDGCIVQAPEPAIEVRSTDVRRKEWHKKAGEYLEAGVVNVCIVDPDAKSVHVFSADQPVRVLTDDDWTLPEFLPGFLIPLAQLFTV
jgi:Uma2 family endonuclease